MQRQALVVPVVFLIVTWFAWCATPVLADDHQASKLVGTWFTSLDPGVPDVAPILAFFTFNKGGTLTQSQTLVHANSGNIDPICGCTASIGHGVWKKKRRNVFEYHFRGFVYSGPNTPDFSLNLSEPIRTVGQHIGFGIASGTIEVIGDRLEGVNVGTIVNLDGELLNQQFPFMELPFFGERLKVQ